MAEPNILWKFLCNSDLEIPTCLEASNIKFNKLQVSIIHTDNTFHFV